MFELNRIDYERVRPLFRKMDMNLPLQAILAGNVSASIFVDNTLHPQTALTWTGDRFYLAGSPGNTDLIAAARKIFLENFAMAAWKSGRETYMVNYPTEKWEVFVTAMLVQKYPIKTMRSYYANKASRKTFPNHLEGYSIRTVDATFLQEKWKNPEFLIDEMRSERESVEDFLSKSFGLCLTHGKEIVGWCLSEYNTGHRCEVGIGVEEEYREQGFATLLAREFIEMARVRDVARIGWHCAAANYASGATALKAGFEKVTDYPAFYGWFDDAINLANNGYYAQGRGEFADALAFYDKAVTLGEVPDRLFWGAACAAAQIGESEKALKYLAQAIDHGYDSPDEIKNSKYLVSLHETQGWQEMIKKLGE